MLDIKLPTAQRKVLKDLQPEIEKTEKALAVLEEAGISAPGLVSELAKIKKMQKVLLDNF